MKPIAELAADLAAGRTTSRALAEQALERIEDPKGEGARVFLRVDRDAALEAADASDRLRKRGVVRSPLEGAPVSIKDLFDVAGQVTTAGSVALKDAPPARSDAPVVARLRAAGAVILGRTNMTEFAFSGLGINPHYGTPGNPFDRARIPGGSSSGAGVSVADGMCAMGLGTDTGGSVRIPSAFCGLAGFKPTQARVPLAGCTPLSTSLDSIGPLARTIACCAITDAVLAGEEPGPLPELPLAGLRFGAPTNYVRDGMDEIVGRAFERALKRLRDGGARIVEFAMPELEEQAAVSAGGGFAAAESWAWHRRLIAAKGEAYDPRVLVRIERGEAMGAADDIDLVARRAELVGRAGAASAPFDALVMPTVPIVPPTAASLAADDAYGRTNMLVLRNCAAFNFFDRCAASLPMQAPGEPPSGFMLVGERLGDRKLLAVAQTVEAALAPR
jgi:aspartyl-tRNA(Asn)/glutamyl-tRNA(Gln) amidotransferase subunit A